MKKINLKYNIAMALVFTLVLTSSCERDLSEDAVPATLDTTGEIFTDGFIGLGTNFYFPFIGDGAKPDVFSVDETEGFESDVSIRIDVPNADDPGGNFAGAGFVIDGAGRDLSGYDALTFWAKASQAATIGSIGFGLDYRASKSNVKFTTNWVKYIIPIPDPSKLVNVRNVFEFAAGGILPGGAEPGQGQEVGYSFWIDELKFERLGTLAQPRPSIMGGEDVVATSFTGGTLNISGLWQTFNSADGTDQTVSATPAYYEFQSSNTNVATVSSTGSVAVVGAGTATITAVLNGVKAAGSLIVESVGDYVAAPIPTVDAANVISIFSNTYTGVSGLNIGVFNNPEIAIEELSIGGDNIISYENLAFVGIGWDGNLDVSSFGFLHVDIQVTQDFTSSQNVVVELLAGDNTAGGYTVQGAQLAKDTWVSVDIPVNGFTNPTGGGGAGNPSLNNISNVIFVGAGISNILVDNIYFHK